MSHYRPDKNCPGMSENTIKIQACYAISINQYYQLNVRVHTQQRFTFDTVYILQLYF